MDVPVTVVGQKMFLDTGQHRFAPGSQKFIKFQFDLSDDWSDLTVFAQWTQNGVGYNTYLDADNCAYLPSEITSGECLMMLYGTGGGDIIGITNAVRLCISDDTFVADGQSTVITQSLYDQITAIVIQIESDMAAFIRAGYQIATMDETKSYLHIT